MTIFCHTFLILRASFLSVVCKWVSTSLPICRIYHILFIHILFIPLCSVILQADRLPASITVAALAQKLEASYVIVNILS
jgi:hypothetical protein